MEFHEIPEKHREVLVESGECWVPKKYRAANWQPAPVTDNGRRTLRQILWERATGKETEGRRLHQHCGTRDCHRPDHLRLGNEKQTSWAEYNRERHARMERAKFGNEHELRQAISLLEARGFARHTMSDRAQLRVKTYRIGRGRRGPVSRRFPGGWWLYWREPLRMAGTKAERRAA